jgi:folate-binding protein YgfZ
MSLFFRPSLPDQTTPDGLGWAWSEIAGDDARDFLQRLTTIDLREISPGQGAAGFFLNPQGRIQNMIWVWCLEEARFGIEYESGEKGREREKLVAWIEQYHFAEKFTLRHSDRRCIWIFDGTTELPSTGKAGDVRICQHGSRDFGRGWITAWGDQDAVEHWLSVAHPSAMVAELDDLEQMRIEALRPRVGRELVETTNPLEAGMRDAIADNKGCYPGQEVIEKIVAIGSPAKRLIRIEGPGAAPARGEKLVAASDPQAELGEITSSATTAVGFVALAFVRKIHAKEGLSVRVAGREARTTGVSA